ncbi:MAG: leucyl/phenylalanyl-tRNA--protein transferase [Proteobacteria bacterium]|nr:MAG: leucyl/phenylalanyl-tRNA--protein transferase [Pseudomonadota bacterium]
MRGSIVFPDPRSADEDGLLCVGGDLKVDTLVSAYSQGIFPWPQEGLPLLWFSPPRRGVLDFSEVHWPKRFLRELKDPDYKITFNQAFAQVIQECAKTPRSHESGTWILPPIVGAYERFHKAGYAHSVECWREGRLVGGLYGVFVEGVFSGESMFHKESSTSKRCLHALVQKLSSQGLGWMDIQMVTPILETFGGKYISREEYLERLAKAHGNPVDITL